MKTNRLTHEELEAIVQALTIMLGGEVEKPDMDPDIVYGSAYEKMTRRLITARSRRAMKEGA